MNFEFQYRRPKRASCNGAVSPRWPIFVKQHVAQREEFDETSLREMMMLKTLLMQRQNSYHSDAGLH